MKAGEDRKQWEDLDFFFNYLDSRDDEEERYKLFPAPKTLISSYASCLSHHHLPLKGLPNNPQHQSWDCELEQSALPLVEDKIKIADQENIWMVMNFWYHFSYPEVTDENHGELQFSD